MQVSREEMAIYEAREYLMIWHDGSLREFVENIEFVLTSELFPMRKRYSLAQQILEYRSAPRTKRSKDGITEMIYALNS